MTSPELDLRATPDPRFPGLLAGAICTLIALTFFLPMFSGQFLAGDDQLIAGYAFRHFGAEYFRQYHHIPQWNPYIFGGIPFFAVVGQGDIFYPTAWLRWIVSTDVGMTLGFFVHIVIAGWAMFGLLRGFRLSWGASLVGGVAYELTGMVVSQMSPGHDGKLFVAALAPLALLMLLRAIRDSKLGSYGGFAIVAGLAILTPQVQTAYYLLVAAGIFTLWLCFGDPERPRDRPAWQPLALATLAALLGVGISMIEVLPILTHVGMTPRAEGGDSYGWAYATAFALPIEELMTAIYPQFNGVNDTYWGQNFFKNHCEYVGALVLILAWFGIAPSRRKKAFTVLATIGGLFLLVALGGHTPFYRLWYTVMPMMNKVRAAGVAFYLVALVLCILAGFGAEELLAGRVKTRTVLTSLAIVGVLAILGAGGVLQGITESLARSIGAGLPDPNAASAMVSRAIQNEAALRMGGIRLLLVALLGGGAFLAISVRRITALPAALLLALVVGLDNWSVLHHFTRWYPAASTTYADDALTTAMKKSPMPFRAYDPDGALAGAGVYQASTLMALDVPAVFGYEGMESRFFDELWGVKNQWSNQLSPKLWDLYATEYLTLAMPFDTLMRAVGQPGVPLQGYHPVLGPVSFPNLTLKKGNATAGYLYQRDTAARWVRIVPAAVTAPDSQVIPTVADPRYPVEHFVLYPDTVKVPTVKPDSAPPAPSPVVPTLSAWQPGAMTVQLTGSDSRTTFLLVAENWYPDWHATIDGKTVPTLRGDGALLSVAIPPGAREVRLWYDGAAYHTGKWLTLLSLLGALGLVAAGRFSRRAAHG